ncbi:hypothetical protein [Brevibacillus fortis]|uniref:hypothetical protein n=1 Tax=Brevibacillus fortis TaxID=2126352 RepID=UPI0038FBF575
MDGYRKKTKQRFAFGETLPERPDRKQKTMGQIDFSVPGTCGDLRSMNWITEMRPFG